MSARPNTVNLWFAPPRRTPWLGLAGLLISGALLAHTLENYFAAQESLRSLGAQAMQVQKASRAQKSVAVVAGANPATLQIRAAALQALAYDWNAVFTLIEQGVHIPWVLQSLEIRQGAREIKLILEMQEIPAQAPGALVGLPAQWRVLEVMRSGDETNRRVRVRVSMQLI
jgi:hypothetical protein